MKNTFFKNCKRFFVFVFDILSAIRREQLLSLSEGQRATALEAKGHRLSQVPRAERWGWRGGGAAARDEPPSLSLRHREGGGGKSMLVKTWRQTQKQQTSDNMTLTTGSQIQKKNNLFGSLGRMYIFFLFKKSRQKPTTSRIYMKLSSASKWTNRLRLRVVKGINLWGVECQ